MRVGKSTIKLVLASRWAEGLYALNRSGFCRVGKFARPWVGILLTAFILQVTAFELSAAPFAYVTAGESSLVEIDLATNTVTATLSPPDISPTANLSGVAVNPAGTFVYVVNYNPSGSVLVINTTPALDSAGTILAVPVGKWPVGVAVNPAGTYAYVGNSSDGTVSVIRTSDNVVTATVSVGDAGGYSFVAVNPAGTYLYVPSWHGIAVGGAHAAVSVIRTSDNTIIATVPVVNSSSLAGVAVNPAGTRIYVVNTSSSLSSGSVTVIDTATNTVTATVPVGTGPVDVAVNPAGTRVYVTNSSDQGPPVCDASGVCAGTYKTGTVSVIDTATNTVIATVPVGNTPHGVAVNPAGTRVYVPGDFSGNAVGNGLAFVSVIDTATNTVIATVPIQAYYLGKIAITPSSSTPVNVIISQTNGGTSQTGTTLNFVSGWNLLGNSTNAPLDVATTLGDITKVTTVWKWVPATSKWAFYAPSMAAPDLATYATNKGYDVLTAINGGEGFWVNAKIAFTASLPAGTAISSSAFADKATPSNNLPKGWSLIAVGDNPSPRNFANAIAISQPVSPAVAATSLTTLWAWDSGSSSWYFYAPSLDNSNGLVNYITTKGYLDFTAKGKTLDPATGFWVNHP